MNQLWRIIKTNTVLRQLQKTIQLELHETNTNRDNVFQSIDAILLRASLVYCKIIAT